MTDASSGLSLPERLKNSKFSLCTSGVEFSLALLLMEACALRKGCPQLRGQTVLIEETDVRRFIVALLAFDSFCAQIVLMPGQNTEFLIGAILAEGLTPSFSIKNGQLVQDEKGGYRVDNSAVATTKWCLFTSGTTGVPKLLQHTLSGLVGKLGEGKSDRDVVWGLLYDHVRYAGLQVILQAMISGNKLVCADNGYGCVPESGFFISVNCLSATPSMWRKMLMSADINNAQFSQITLGGEIADQALLDRLHELFPRARITHIYASTEAGVGLKINDMKEGFPAKWLEERDDLRLSPSGTLMLRVLDLAVGREISARLSEDGFLDTQDLVAIELDRCKFLGRISGTVNVGGNKVSPVKVAGIIRELSFVKTVLVYGKANPVLGAVVAAKLVISDELSQHEAKVKVMSFCKSRLEPYEVPMILTVVDDLPLTTTGKVMLHEQ